MGKVKTHRGARKRVKITATGKIMVRGVGVRHILTKKNRRNKRKGHQFHALSTAQARMIKKLVPNL